MKDERCCPLSKPQCGNRPLVIQLIIPPAKNVHNQTSDEWKFEQQNKRKCEGECMRELECNVNESEKASLSVNVNVSVNASMSVM